MRQGAFNITASTARAAMAAGYPVTAPAHLPVIQLVRTHPNAKLPTRGTEGAVGYDVCAVEDLRMDSGDRALIDTGWKIAVADGYEVQVRPRSGLALKHGVTVVNSPGTVDPDYRGMMGIILINHGKEAFSIKAGDRIAQLVVAPVCLGLMHEVDAFMDSTTRGEAGYGSTGVK